MRIGFFIPVAVAVSACGVKTYAVELDASQSLVRGPSLLWQVVDVLGGEPDEDELSSSSGSLRALSLAVRIEDAIGAMLYSGCGGIELLEGVDFSTGQPVPYSSDRLLNSPERNREAVRIALQPLTRGG
jgi:hypothetical protein